MLRKVSATAAEAAVKTCYENVKTSKSLLDKPARAHKLCRTANLSVTMECSQAVTANACLTCSRQHYKSSSSSLSSSFKATDHIKHCTTHVTAPNFISLEAKSH